MDDSQGRFVYNRSPECVGGSAKLVAAQKLFQKSGQFWTPFGHGWVQGSRWWLRFCEEGMCGMPIVHRVQWQHGDMWE